MSLPTNPHDKFAVAAIKDSKIVACTVSKSLFTDHVVLKYTKRLCRPLSGICHITEGRRKEKGLKYFVYKYNYYYVPTKYPMFIRHLEFVFYLALSPAHLMRPGVYRDQL